MRTAIEGAVVAAIVAVATGAVAQNAQSTHVASPMEPATVVVAPVATAAPSGTLVLETSREAGAGPIAGDVKIRLRSDPPEASVGVGKFMSSAGDVGPQSYAFDLKAVPELDAEFLAKVASGQAVVDVAVSQGRRVGGVASDASLSIVTSTFSK